jgi:hypothetical protein
MLPTDVNLKNYALNLINKNVHNSKTKTCIEVIQTTCLNTDIEYLLQA